MTEPYIRKGDVIGCSFDLSVPMMSFYLNGVKVKGNFKNMNLDGMFFPVVSCSARVRCVFFCLVILMVNRYYSYTSRSVLQLPFLVWRWTRSLAIPSAIRFLPAVRMSLANSDIGSWPLFPFWWFDKEYIGRTSRSHERHGFCPAACWHISGKRLIRSLFNNLINLYTLCNLRLLYRRTLKLSAIV